MEVNQVRAHLDSALQTAQNAVRLLNAAKAEIENAQEVIRMVRLTSVDPIGLPALDAMLENTNHAIQSYPRFDDAVNRYRINL